MSARSSTLRPVTVPSFSAAQGQLLPLVAAVVGRQQRLGAGLGVLDRLAEPTGHGDGDALLGRRLQLAAEPAADVGGDDPDLGLGDAHRRGDEEPQDVRDLGGRPDRHLLAGRVDDHRAGLHEGRDQPLLAVLALDDDAVGAGLGDGLVDVAAGALLGGVELPEGALVGAEVGVGEHLVGGGLLEVERRRQLLVVDVDELGGVARRGGRPGDDDGHDLAGEGDPVDGDRRGAPGVFWSAVIGQALARTPWTSLRSSPVATTATPRAPPWPRWCRWW